MTENSRNLLRREGEKPSKRDLDRAGVFALVAIAEELKLIRELLAGLAERGQP